MFGSSFDNLLLIACLWQNVAFLQCRSTVEVAKHSELPGQQITRCLKSCAFSFQDVKVGTISNVKLSRRQSCYSKCLGRSGEQSSFENNRKPLDATKMTESSRRIKREELSVLWKPLNYKQVMPSSERFKRSASNSHHNSTSSWDPDGCVKNITSHNYSANIPDGLRVTFYKLQSTERCHANVSWKPVHNNSVTGYRILYLWNGLSPQLRCEDLKKNDRNYVIKNSSYGLIYQSSLAVSVITLPHNGGEADSQVYTVPVGCFRPEDGETKSLTTDKKTNNTVVAAMTSACVIAVLALFVLLYFRYCRRSQKRSFSRSDLEFEYDAFVIFSSEDSDWVIKSLIPTLEEKHGLKCCLHYRDFTLGVPIRQNMVDSVYKCKKTVAVVSTNFFNSKYCGFELDYALHRLMEKKDDSLVVIKLDNVDRNRLPKELQKRSYIDYPKSIEKETWEKKLIKCLQTSSYPSQSNIL